jgi:hypothetical protein
LRLIIRPAFQQALPGRGHAQASPFTFKQGGAEQLLQPLDLLADRALGQVKGIRRRRHAGAIRYGDKGPEQGEIEVASHPAIMTSNDEYCQYSLSGCRTLR